MTAATIVERYRAARRDPGLVILEGFHALKHALRFGAGIVEAVAAEPARAERLALDLAPDVADAVRTLVEPVPTDVFDRLSPAPIPTGVIALARRPAVDVPAALDDTRPDPVVLLEAPASPHNIGAAVRVAAAGGAAAIFTTGRHDPWNPASVRAANGLHFALPVARVEALPPSDRPLVALDPVGEPLAPGTLPPRAILAFGTERQGLSRALLAAADHRVRIPMRAGVSSLNLATAVAVAVYAASWGAARSP